MPTGGPFREQLARIAANRHSPEAAALYRVLFEYTEKRVRRTSRSARLGASRQEEVVGEVLLQLMKGSLAGFRGGSLPELLAFVRTIADRAVWRVIRTLERERLALEDAGLDGMSRWTGAAPASADSFELMGTSPLEPKDQVYLCELLRAGSKAEYARRAGVSRAAVTQRVKRIRDRIAQLSKGDQLSHEVWLQQQAHAAVSYQD